MRDPLTVASWPRPYASNPYLAGFTSSLEARGVRVHSARYMAELVARPRGAQWLHLHWPEWMLRDPSRSRARARAAWFFALCDAARARGVRLSWTAHNLLGHDEPHADLAVAYRRAWLARCDAVVGHFEAAERDLRELGFRGDFRWAPHPNYADTYPAAPARDDARRALGYDDDALLLLSFGNLEPYKNVASLIAHFRAQAPANARLHVAGKPTSAPELRAIALAAGGDPRVRIEARHATREQTARLFAASDALVLAYRAFYTSGVASLALTYGLPVVGPPRHQLSDLASKPFFVPLEDPARLGEALSRLPLGERGVHARAAALAESRAATWERMADALALAWSSAGQVTLRR